MMTPIEISRIGYQALADALGFDGMVRFLRQFETGFGDYTTEREQMLDGFTLSDIFDQIEQARREASDSFHQDNAGPHR